jgi:uncharacterized membrane protein YqjE
MTEFRTDGSSAAPEERSLGALFSSVTEDISTLMRQEIALARAELQESGAKAGKAGGMVAVAGVAANLALVFLSVAVWWGLGDLIDSNFWSAVIVAVIWAIVAAVLAVRAKAQLREVRGVPQTTDTVKKIPNALQGHEEKNR